MNDADTKTECERLFQAGGPKVYFQDPNGSLRASSFSAARSVGMRDEQQSVYARRKNRHTGRYTWELMASPRVIAARTNVGRLMMPPVATVKPIAQAPPPVEADRVKITTHFAKGDKLTAIERNYLQAMANNPGNRRLPFADMAAYLSSALPDWHVYPRAGGWNVSRYAGELAVLRVEPVKPEFSGGQTTQVGIVVAHKVFTCHENGPEEVATATTQARARRLVACWNYCRGKTITELESA